MEHEDVRLEHWKDRDVLDIDGDKIGTVDDVYYDEATGRPQWLLVKTGLFGTKRTLVPALEATRTDEGKLTVPYTEERVKDAPRVDEEEALSAGSEQKLYAYYNLDYGASAEPVRWGPGTSEEELQRLTRPPSQCQRLDSTVMMRPYADAEDDV